jgi:hypothetical protein
LLKDAVEPVFVQYFKTFAQRRGADHAQVRSLRQKNDSSLPVAFELNRRETFSQAVDSNCSGVAVLSVRGKRGDYQWRNGICHLDQPFRSTAQVRSTAQAALWTAVFVIVRSQKEHGSRLRSVPWAERSGVSLGIVLNLLGCELLLVHGSANSPTPNTLKRGI